MLWSDWGRSLKQLVTAEPQPRAERNKCMFACLGPVWFLYTWDSLRSLPEWGNDTLIVGWLLHMLIVPYRHAHRTACVEDPLLRVFQVILGCVKLNPVPSLASRLPRHLWHAFTQTHTHTQIQIHPKNWFTWGDLKLSSVERSHKHWEQLQRAKGWDVAQW